MPEINTTSFPGQIQINTKWEKKRSSAEIQSMKETSLIFGTAIGSATGVFAAVGATTLLVVGIVSPISPAVILFGLIFLGISAGGAVLGGGCILLMATTDLTHYGSRPVAQSLVNKVMVASLSKISKMSKPWGFNKIRIGNLRKYGFIESPDATELKKLIKTYRELKKLKKIYIDSNPTLATPLDNQLSELDNKWNELRKRIVPKLPSPMIIVPN